MNPNDTVSYDSSYLGVLTGASTSKLVVVGDAITFDATALAGSTPKIWVNGELESTASIFTMNLLPGSHEIEDMPATSSCSPSNPMAPSPTPRRWTTSWP